MKNEDNRYTVLSSYDAFIFIYVCIYSYITGNNIILGFVLVTRVYLEKEKFLKILKFTIIAKLFGVKAPLSSQICDWIGDIKK